ncbi:TPA: hypothetical protein ACGO9X_001829 [Streptococcus suis]
MIGTNFLQLDTEISNWCVMSRYRSMLHTPCYTRAQRKNIESMLDISFELREKEIRQSLVKGFVYEYVLFYIVRYCPICIAKGFHSYVHQLYFTKYCYIHTKEEMKDTCPMCGNHVLSNTLSRTPPFQCCCGYNFTFRYELNVLLEFWKIKPKLFEVPNFHKKTYYVYPVNCSEIPETFLSELYYNNSKQLFNTIRKQTFSTLSPEIKIHSSNKILKKAYIDFRNRIKNLNLINEEVALKKFDSEFLTFKIYYFRILHHQEIQFLRYSGRFRHIKWFEEWPKSEFIREYFVDFLIALSNKFSRIDYTQYNWIVYHFMMYLQSEVMNYILNELPSWQPRPFFYKIEEIGKENRIEISLKYNSF